MITLGLHMICAAETEHLRACLESLKPVAFDQIIVGITRREGWEGETRQIVEEFAGTAIDLTWLPKVECEDYGPCIASFAQARNEVYNRLTTDWAFWIDADDTLDNAEDLRPLVEQLDAEGIDCLMLPYFYGFDNNGNCITILTRERAVRRSRGWRWIRRVHEGLMSLSPTQLAKAPDIVIRHNSPTGRGWPIRNLKLLLIEHEENPTDKRTICYIGHQYYALQKWADAIDWYEKYLQYENIKEERWQALNFLADCYRLTGQPHMAIQRDMEAASLFPDWADPYFGLAETYARMEDWESCIWWDKVGRMARIPDAAIFMNPLDYTYNPALFANIAYFQKGDLDTAIKIVEEALQVSPNAEHLQVKLAAYYQIRELRAKGLAAVKLWEGMPDEAVLQTPLPDGLLDVPEVRQRVARAAFQTRRRDSPWAVFFCGKTLEPWAPPTLNTTGIGGSETAVIHVAYQLAAKAGWHVDVYNDCVPCTGIYDGVGYWPFEWYKPDLAPDLLVGWRHAGLWLADHKAGGRVKWLWVHDLHMGDALTPERARFYDRVMPVSQWHADYLKMVYPFLDNINPTRNAIDLARFAQEVERNPRKVIYASSPDRGLDLLLALWQEIVKCVPDAELHVFYGWQNIDKFPQLAQLKWRIEHQLSTATNVIWRGRLNQNELAREFLSAGCWFYPTSFLEVSCVAGDTLIDMPGASTKHPLGVTIKELAGKSGFPTWCYNEDTGTFQLATVKWLRRTRRNAEVWKVEWEDGTCLKATPDHLVLTYNRGWVPVRELSVGDRAVALKKRLPVREGTGEGDWKQEHRLTYECAQAIHKVKSVSFYGYEDVYNMEIDGPPNFVANGVVIHNCITAMECMAAGVAMLTTRCGALPETVGDRGILIPGNPNSETYHRMFLTEAVRLLTDEAYRRAWAAKGLAHAAGLSWEGVAREWLEEWGKCVS